MIFHVSVMLEELEARLDPLARAGFYPEVRMNDARLLMNLPDGHVGRMRGLIEARGLTTFTHGPFLGLDVASLNEHIAAYSAECLLRGLELTAGLGGPVMVMHTNYSPFFSRAGLRVWLGNWSERMRPVVERAGELGVRVALENAWEERPEVLAHLVDLVPGGAAVCLDTGHVNDGLSDDHLPPGEGIFDFSSLVALLRARPSLPLMTLEVDPARAERGREYLEGLFSGGA